MALPSRTAAPVPRSVPSTNGALNQALTPERTTSSAVAMRPMPHCKFHPHETLQFFCMDCESECLCSECAVEAAHGGRDVVKVMKAYESLAGDMDRVLECLAIRRDSHSRSKRNCETMRNDLTEVIARGKANLQDAFRQLRATLAQKEAELTAAVDSCETAAGQAMASRVTPVRTHAAALQEAQATLRKIDTRGGNVGDINAYAASRAQLAELVKAQPGPDGGDASSVVRWIGELVSDVRSALQEQIDGVHDLNGRVHEVCRAAAAITGQPCSGPSSAVTSPRIVENPMSPQ